GLAAAIVRAGGELIQDQSDAWVRQHGPVSHAEPAYTGAGRLPCRYVIHAVGPVWQGGGENEDANLAAAVTGSLQLADRLGLQSIALPAISTGIFGFPKARAARLILDAISAYRTAHPQGGLREVRLALLNDGSIEPFLEAFDDHFSTKS
ncbi:MAG: macro domain-containing protein, partial [Anaerolineales bacterium]|nr:macro domain-containing protein [Anaerolineales bacterium]